MRSLLPRLVVTVAFAGLMQVACSSDDSSGNGGTGGTGTGGRGGAGGAGTGGSGTGGTGTGGTGTGGSGTGGAGTGGTGTGGSGSGGAGGTGGTGTGGGSGGGGGADAAGSETGGADTAPGGDGGGEVGGAAKMAVATMMPLAGGTITGKVTLIEVPGGVQITYALENCPPGNHPTHIHNGNGCAANQQGMHWDGARGENIGPAGGRITCGADMKGTLTYVRMSNVAANLRWTIGGGGETDVIGHPVIVHGVDNDQQRHGCGVITAAP